MRLPRITPDEGEAGGMLPREAAALRLDEGLFERLVVGRSGELGEELEARHERQPTVGRYDVGRLACDAVDVGPLERLDVAAGGHADCAPMMREQELDPDHGVAGHREVDRAATHLRARRAGQLA